MEEEKDITMCKLYREDNIQLNILRLELNLATVADVIKMLLEKFKETK